MNYGNIALSALGAVLMAMCLLTEAGERRLQQWLEATWVRLDDASTRAVSRHMAITQRVAATTNSIFDGLFGSRLFSARAVAVSATLGLASFCGFLALFLTVMWPLAGSSISANLHMDPNEAHLVMFFAQSVAGYVGFCLFVFAILPAMLRPSGVRAWGVLVMIFWVYTLGECGTLPTKSGGDEVSPYFLAIALGAACDIAFVVIARRLFRAIEKCCSQLRSIALISAGLVVALGAIVLPLAGGMGLSLTSPTFSLSLMLTAITNIVDMLVMLVPIAVLFLLVLHKLLWPVLKQPLYTLQRYRVFADHKRLVLGVGIAVFTVGGLGLPSWVEQGLRHLVG